MTTQVWITDLDRGDRFKVPAHAHCPVSGEWATFESIERLGPDDEWLTFVCVPENKDIAVPGRIHDSDLPVEKATN
jgi:hypothetical protein